MIKIRCSTLSSYNDCPRRSSCKIIPIQISDAGYQLRSLPSSIGAAVGTAAHQGSEHHLKGILSGATASEADCIEQGIVTLREKTETGAIYDQTTPDTNTGEKQVARLVKSFTIEIAPQIKPKSIEIFRPANIGGGYQLTGHTDIEDIENYIDDLKFGSKLSDYHGQMGGYLLLKSTHDGRAAGARIRHMPRISIKKNYPGASTIEYDTTTCIKTAWYTINRIKADIDNFLKTGSHWSFPANPSSVLCSDKYCTAWGTKYCDFWRDN